MGQVVVEIGGRSYPLSCRDGDEDHLAELAGDIAMKADGLIRSLGAMSEARLLLMAALMIADELHDLRSSKTPAWVPVPDNDPAAERLATLVARAEALADQFDKVASAG